MRLHNRLKSQILLIFVIVGPLVFTACGSKRSSTGSAPVQAATTPAVPASNAGSQPEGSFVGGGSDIDENSSLLLALAVTGPTEQNIATGLFGSGVEEAYADQANQRFYLALTNTLERLNPATFSDYANGELQHLREIQTPSELVDWMIEVFDRLHLRPNQSSRRSRGGSSLELFLDYSLREPTPLQPTEVSELGGADALAANPRIIVPRLFFQTQASVPVRTYLRTHNGELVTRISEIRFKMLHEIAHLFGIGVENSPDNPDSNAAAFAGAVEDAHQKNNLICLLDSTGVSNEVLQKLVNPKPVSGTTIRAEPTRFYFVINRPTGQGIVINNETYFRVARNDVNAQRVLNQLRPSDPENFLQPGLWTPEPVSSDIWLPTNEQRSVDNRNFPSRAQNEFNVFDWTYDRTTENNDHQINLIFAHNRTTYTSPTGNRPRTERLSIRQEAEAASVWRGIYRIEMENSGVPDLSLDVNCRETVGSVPVNSFKSRATLPQQDR